MMLINYIANTNVNSGMMLLEKSITSIIVTKKKVPVQKIVTCHDVTLNGIVIVYTVVKVIKEDIFFNFVLV